MKEIGNDFVVDQKHFFNSNSIVKNWSKSYRTLDEYYCIHLCNYLSHTCSLTYLIAFSIVKRKYFVYMSAATNYSHANGIFFLSLFLSFLLFVNNDHYRDNNDGDDDIALNEGIDGWHQISSKNRVEFAYYRHYWALLWIPK